jgi:hypothetical protein
MVIRSADGAARSVRAISYFTSLESQMLRIRSHMTGDSTVPNIDQAARYKKDEAAGSFRPFPPAHLSEPVGWAAHTTTAPIQHLCVNHHSVEILVAPPLLHGTDLTMPTRARPLF